MIMMNDDNDDPWTQQFLSFETCVYVPTQEFAMSAQHDPLSPHRFIYTEVLAMAHDVFVLVVRRHH